MLKRLSSILYFVTAVATLDAGLASLNFARSVLFPTGFKWLASLAILHFAAPALFLLASLAVLRTDNRSRLPKWITAAATLAALMLICVHYGLRWRTYLEAAGALASLVLIVGSLASRASTIALVAVVTYCLVEVDLLITSLEMFWDFGGSVQHFFAKIIPPVLVLACLVIATASHFITRERTALIEPHSPGN